MKTVSRFAITTLLYLLFVNVSAQTDKGIQFQTLSSFRDVLAKAKAEDKFIFIDCYTTWCGPCKKMDNEVYMQKEVGDVFNAKFISVKVQMDQTELDGEFVKSWYADADKIKSSYTIAAYPSYLFLSPDGKPVHKAVGYKSPKQFIALASDVFDPRKQFYSILENFQPGKLDTAEMRGLVRAFAGSGTDLPGKILADYLSRIPRDQIQNWETVYMIEDCKRSPEVKKEVLTYLKTIPLKEYSKDGNADLLSIFSSDPEVKDLFLKYMHSTPADEFFTQRNLKTLDRFRSLVDIGDKIFNMCLTYKDSVNRIAGRKGYAESIIKSTLSNRIVSVFRQDAEALNSDIDWEKVKSKLAVYASGNELEKIFLDEKVGWYEFKTNQALQFKQKEQENRWGAIWADAIGEKIVRNEMDLSGFSGNTIEFSIYRYSKNTETIKKAIDWYSKLMKERTLGISFMYVYAGLLYRTGKINAGILWQEEMVTIVKGKLCDKSQNPKLNEWYQKQLAILNGMKSKLPGDQLIFRDR